MLTESQWWQARTRHFRGAPEEVADLGKLLGHDVILVLRGVGRPDLLDENLQASVPVDFAS